MAGIYLHIPFCVSRCIYCDFYSTTHNEKSEAYIRALANELRLRADYLKSEEYANPTIETIYIGGGTPSLLTPDQLELLFETLYKTYSIAPDAEITIEANPDDLSTQKIKSLQQLPVNRISIGIQTFDDRKLKLLRRRHNSLKALKAVSECQQAGFDNISIDLIYGLPEQTLSEWESDLEQAISLNIQHLSAYALIYEENTAIWKMREQHLVKEAREELSLDMFNILIDRTQQARFEHYEISNFAKPERRSRHNSSYWKGISYLGCGPSAHSFNGHHRQWNHSNLEQYIDNVGKCTSYADFINAPWIDKEVLTTYEQYNDWVITSLRTSDGLDLDRLRQTFGNPLADYCLQSASKHLQKGVLEIIEKEQSQEGLLKLTRHGLFLSDGIMSDLLYVD